MSDAVTITLPGPPVAYAVEPARLVAWLLSRRWRECASHDPGFRSFEREGAITSLRTGPWSPGYALSLVGRHADDADIEARDLAALLAPPPEGPALQWAHASADTRAPVLALLDSEAADSRHNAAVARAEGKTAEALAEEGRAMAHEAAAAVLRGGGR